MKIEAEIRKMIPRGKLKAFASITIDDKFVITGIRVVEGEKGPFVSMPSRQTLHGTYVNICFPITGEARKEFDRVVLDAYDRTLEEMYNEKNQKNHERTGRENPCVSEG